jgi:hypothetical protein
LNGRMSMSGNIGFMALTAFCIHAGAPTMA